LIAFDSYDAALGVEAPYLGTFVVRSDGTHRRSLTVPEAVDGLHPVWAPDGRSFVLSSWWAPGPARPALIDADGSDLEHLEPPVGMDEDLTCHDWSPDGRRLLCAISGIEPEVDGIYTMNTDGTDLMRLTHSPFHYTEGPAGACGGGDGRAVYSPDGELIAFIRQRCGTGPNPACDESAAILVMNRDGSEPREIVEQGGVRSHPGSQLSWSPDGNSIVFGSQDGRLYLVRPDGTGLTQIVLPREIGDHFAYGPAWSPDGAMVVFSLYLGTHNSTDLHAIAPDGSAFVQITADAGAESAASWGP
jgi:Tol biopolymer transport system component